MHVNLFKSRLHEMSLVLIYCEATNLDQMFKNRRHFLPGMGLQLGVFGFFHNQNNSDFCVKISTPCKTSAHVCEDHGRILFAFASMCVCVFVVSKNPNNRANWSSMADAAITQGGIHVKDLVSLVQTCE